MLAGDAPAEPDRELEQLVGRALGPAALVLVCAGRSGTWSGGCRRPRAPSCRRRAGGARRSRASRRSPPPAARRGRRCPRSPCRLAPPAPRARRRRASARAPRSRRPSPAPRSRSRPRRAPPAPPRASRATSSAEPSTSVRTRNPPSSSATGNDAAERCRVSPSRYSSAATGSPLPSTRASASQPAAVPECTETIGEAASGAGARRSHTAVMTPSVPSEPTSEAAEVVAGDVLPDRAADADELPGRDDDLDARHPVARDAVLEGVRPARVGGDVAADLRLLGGTGVGREEEAVLAREPAHVRGRDARLGLHPPDERVERADPPHALEAEDDAAERDRAAREAGAAAAGRDRDALLVAPGDHLRDLLGVPREHDRVGVPAEAARLGRVGEVGRRHALRDDLRAEAVAECPLDRGRCDAHAPRTGFVSEPTLSISTVTSSPSTRKIGGVRTKPTPGGVPVRTRSPSSSSMPSLM